MSERSDGQYNSYYGQPIIKEPVWKPVIPAYFFAGGLGGASAVLAFAARLTDFQRLARSATLIGFGSLAVSPVLLIVDLGKPSRFYNMLRLFKVTSPMSVGSWVLSGAGGSIGVAAVCEVFGIFPRIKLIAQFFAALFGLPLSTYTAALIADTAVPVWHEARRELPFVFAGGAAASAGAAALFATPRREATDRPDRLAIAGAVWNRSASRTMEHNLGGAPGGAVS